MDLDLAVDDWQCYVDTKNLRRCYRSKSLQKIQHKVPKAYRGTIGRIPFFTDEFVIARLNEFLKAAALPVGVSPIVADQVTEVVGVRDVIENDTCCASFHRFLVSTYAEENLLFIAAVELFKNGEWKGMKVLGEQGNAEDSSDRAMLSKQLKAARSSVRLGFEESISHHKKADAMKIYDRFLVDNAPLWVCVDDKTAKEVEERLNLATKSTNLEDVFDDAKAQVIQGMTEELLPRFLRAALGQGCEKGFESTVTLEQSLIDVMNRKRNNTTLQRRLFH